MSTHRHIDKLCVIVLVLTLVVTLLFLNGTALGIQGSSRAAAYESRLFDTSRVHTIDIVMDDWDGFLATCENEEYAAAAVVIDGEAFQNVGLRAKGNTSLSTVSAMDSDRYSFKLEFDHYDSAKSYYGLDKLCLNNLIQDATYMKDYLTYRLMGSFGVAAPLCSYVYITVNGQDWGLYLAVEGVEDGFLQRSYGSGHGALYKPDSLGFGGGRGNGKNFNMDDIMNSLDEETAENFRNFGRPGGFDPSAVFGGELPQGFEMQDIPDRGMAGGMGASDVKLQYIDDDPDSYANIFDNAKTDITGADRSRLIASLKQLGSGEDMESAVDIDAVLRYFVVHNFVVNGDSYTGSMIHNYYLYEEDGRLSMIPWDYNLAFGGFSSFGGAASAVNDPIDTPLSVTGSGDRPMIDWMLTNDGYLGAYHRYFAEFLENTDIAALIGEAQALIAPYVEKDPTAFYSREEFETGVAALAEFCRLRAESVRGQLDGTIPSTTDGQSADPSALVDASRLDLSDMGSMGGGMGQGEAWGGRMHWGGGDASRGDFAPGGTPGEGQGGELPGAPPGEGEAPPDQPDLSRLPVQGQEVLGGGDRHGRDQFWGEQQDRTQGGGADTSALSPEALLPVGVSALFLLAGLLIAFKVKH